jgi:hypothetical protein
LRRLSGYIQDEGTDVQVVINEPVLKREARISKVLLGATFLLLGAGMFLSLQADRWAKTLEPWLPPEFLPILPVAFTYAIVLIGITLMQIANPRIRRYAPQHRQDARLRQILKGLDDRYVLYAFLGSGLPDYLLVGPSGVYPLITRPQDGEITCRDDRWTRNLGPVRGLFVRLYGNPLGSPSYDASQAAQRVRALLQQKLPSGVDEPPIQTVVVFTADRVRLRVERCSTPATTARELRKVITRARGRLNQAQMAQVRAALDTVRPA